MDHEGQMDHDGMGNQDGRMDPVAKAFFSVMDSGGNFDEAFKAGERVAREFDQREGDYDEEQWNKCRDQAYQAGRKVADEGADPGQVFDAVGRAGNECRDGGPRGEGDHGGDHVDQGDDAPNWTFEDVDANGDGVISRDEARAKYGIDPQGNPVSDFDQQFDNVDSNGSGDVDPDEHAAAVNNQGGDCGFPMGDDGSVMVSRPDGTERWLMAGEYNMNDDGSVTINKDGEPDNGATVTPPPCNDDGGSNN